METKYYRVDTESGTVYIKDARVLDDGKITPEIPSMCTGVDLDGNMAMVFGPTTIEEVTDPDEIETIKMLYGQD